MVFAPRGGSFEPPNRDDPSSEDAPVRPIRPEHVDLPSLRPGRQLAWRAIVHVRGDEKITTEWHLAACAAPGEAGAHCAEGQRLIQAGGDPEGHCLVDAVCPRCAGSR